MKNISALYLSISTAVNYLSISTAVHYLFFPLQTQYICKTSPSVAMNKSVCIA